MKIKLIKYNKIKTKCHQNWKYGEDIDGYDVLFEREDKKKYIVHFVEAEPNFSSGVMLAGKKYLVDGYTLIGFQRAVRLEALLDKMVKMTQKEIGE